nr:cobyrinate a,c-diamide synthase [Gammaproteobacteria bacterium]
AAAATSKDYSAQTFKKGPDYIDPLWLAMASGQPCYNLDPRQQSEFELAALYEQRSESAQISLVEGTMGLHDGMDISGSDSNAAIAKTLDLPVLLVVDCRGMHRTVAALLNGLMLFDPDVAFAGVILNRVKTDRHGRKISNAINTYTDLPIIGEVPEYSEVAIAEQNLGLLPAPDSPEANNTIQSAKALILDHCDLDALFAHVPTVEPEQIHDSACNAGSTQSSNFRIAIAQDEAFHFYYQDDLDYLKACGVELIAFSPMSECLPANIDGLIIGGGFPEHHAQSLSENEALKCEIREAISAGMPVHAECGGLMFLCQTLVTEQGVRWPLAGVINGTIRMRKKPVGRGYIQLAELDAPDHPFWAHEFHHSEVVFDSPPEFVYRVKRGHGIDGQHDGVRVHNAIASYAHFRQSASTPWIDNFLARVREQKIGLSNYV